MRMRIATHHGLLLLRRFLLQFEQILLIIRTGHIIIFTLLLREQLEPTVCGILDDLRNAKRQGAHEIVARSAIPVPHLNQYAPVLVLRLQIAAKISSSGYFHQNTVSNWVLLAEGLIPDRIQASLDGARLLLRLILVIGYQLDLHIRIA